MKKLIRILTTRKRIKQAYKQTQDNLALYANEKLNAPERQKYFWAAVFDQERTKGEDLLKLL